MADEFREYCKRLKRSYNVEFETSLFSSAWCYSNVGTIFTFQGKEADVVIVLTGLQGNSTGAAITIVGNKPNLLNVAVTRAKERIYFVGDSNLWKQIPYFNFVFDELSVARSSDLSV